MSDDRLVELFRLVDREDRHLLAVRHRLLGDDCAVDAERVKRLLGDDVGIDRLVHEYIDRPADLAPALERACRFTDRMHADYGAIRRYAVAHLDIDLPAETG